MTHESGGNGLAGSRRQPIWQILIVLILMAGLSFGAFQLGLKNQKESGSSYSSDISGNTSTDTSTDTEWMDQSDTGFFEQQIEYLVVPNVLGYGSTSVLSELRRLGFGVREYYTTGDPSISARINNGCPVVDQSPAAGSEVPYGTTVTILSDCPMTGNW